MGVLNVIALFRQVGTTQPRSKLLRCVPKTLDSLDIVEALILVEGVFGTDIPSDDAESFGGPGEIVD